MVAGDRPRGDCGRLHGQWRPAHGGDHRFDADRHDRVRFRGALVDRVDGDRGLGVARPATLRSVARTRGSHADLHRAVRTGSAHGAGAVRLDRRPCRVLHRQSLADDATARRSDGV